MNDPHSPNRQEGSHLDVRPPQNHNGVGKRFLPVIAAAAMSFALSGSEQPAESLPTSAATVEQSVDDTHENAPLPPDLIGWHILAYGAEIDSQQVLADLENVGARRAVFNPALFMHDDQIEIDNKFTPEPGEVSELARVMQEKGIQFVVKPILDDTSLEGPDGEDAYRADFEPADPDRWFETYFEAVDRQFAAAHPHGVNELDIGTEMSALEAPKYAQYWTDAVERFREKYPGIQITYTTKNWSYDTEKREYTVPAFVESLDSLGISGYFPLDEGDLGEQWDEEMGTIAELEASLGIPVELSEAGISFSAPLSSPASENREDGPRNERRTTKFITELCRAAVRNGVKIRIWAGSYTNHIPADHQHGFYIGHPENAELQESIEPYCRTENSLFHSQRE